MATGFKQIKSEIIKTANMGGWTNQPLACTDDTQNAIVQ